MITNILCPVDCSDCSRQALQFALALAKWRAAHVNVLNVGSAVLLYPALVSRVLPAVAAAPTRAERATHVARFLEPFVNSHHPIDVILEEGDVAATIAAAARDHAIDLIVMGTHGRTGVARLALGPVVEQIVRTASCPVLVVPPASLPLPWFHGFRRVLCSAGVDRQFASLLTEGDGARITTLPQTESYGEILQAASETRPDLMVWDRERTDIGLVVRKATVPVLSVATASGVVDCNHQLARCAP